MSSARKPELRSRRGQLDRRRRDEADIRWGQYVRPGPSDGLHYVRFPHSDALKLVGSALPNQSLRPAQVVGVASHTGNRDEVIIAAQIAGKLGGANFPFPQSTGAELDVLGVTAADPDEWPAGAVDLPVTLTGYGFNEDPPDTFTPVRRNEANTAWEGDPTFELEFVEWVDAQHVNVLVTVDEDAADGYPASVDPERA